MSRVFSGILACLLLAFSTAAFAVPRYAITNLGSFAGVSLNPTCISESGAIAGTSSDGRAFVYTSSTGVTFVSPAAGYASIAPTAVNDSGEFVGCFHNAYGNTNQSFIYKPGVGAVAITPGPSYQTVCGINNSGVAVGYYVDASQAVHVYSRSVNGLMTDLHVIDGSAYYSWENASINNSGQVLGSYWTEMTMTGGFNIATVDALLYSGAQTLDLNSIGEVANLTSELTRRIIRANDINNLGQMVGIAGQYETAWGDPGISLDTLGADPMEYDPEDAFLYTPGSAPIDLGVLPGYYSYSEARALNDLGQVVGCSAATTSMGDITHAFLYSDGQMYDLNTLVDSAQGWTFTDAGDINNNGQIIASARRQDGLQWISQTFILTPVSEPSSLAALLSGVAATCIVFRRRHR